MNPRISIVVPCFNAEAFLEETVASAATQTLQQIELFIVDDGSDDRSVALAQELATRWPDTPITVMEIPHSGHPAHPRNAGVEAARGDLVVCLDADDLLTPTYLERCVAALDAHPEVAIAYTDQQQFDASETYITNPEYDFYMLTHLNYVGAASVFRRQAWVELGGFNPRTPYEDWNFWLACGERGYYGIKVPNTHWLYRVRGDGRYSTYGSLRDRRTKALFVARRPTLYTTGQQRWAQAVLSDDDATSAVTDRFAIIPEVAPAGPSETLARAVAGMRPGRSHVPPRTDPRVSVVIPALAGSGALTATIDSALAQRRPGGPVEVIVVTSATDDVLAWYGDSIRTVTADTPDESAAHNAGLDAATGEYLAVIRPGDVWPDDRLWHDAEVLDTNPRIGLVRTSCLFRASLLSALHPLPEGTGDPEQWVADCVGAVADVDSGHGIIPSQQQPPLVTLLTQPTVAVAWLDEVLANHWLLQAFARMDNLTAYTTLVVLAAEGADLSQLIQLFQDDPQLRDASCDAIVFTEPATIPGQRLLAARASSRVTTRPSPSPYNELPVNVAVLRWQTAELR